jgi:protocatechuate 3,4-dioxygenase beta subunit
VSRSGTLGLGAACVGAVAGLVALFSGASSDAFLDGERDASAADAAAFDPAGGGSGGLSALSAEEQAARRAREEAAAKAAAAPVFTRAEGVFGRVLGSRGDPIPGATLTLYAYDPMTAWDADLPSPLATAVSDAKGAFLLGPAPEGVGLRVRGEAKGHAATVAWAQTRGTQVDVVLYAGGAVRVRVQDEAGKALVGASVRHPTTQESQRTGPDGVALLEGMLPGSSAVRVSHDGYAAVTLHDVVVAIGKTVEKTCVLSPALAVEGRVVDPSEQPVADAEVVARFNNRVVAQAKSGEDGRFRLEPTTAAGEALVLVATKEGHGPGGAQVTPRAGAPTGDTTLRLSTVARIEGLVEDADGVAVAGAEVLFARGWGAGSGDEATVTTGPDGSFSLEAPPRPGRESQPVVVVARAAGKGAGAVSAPVATAGSPPPPPAVIRLSGAGVVSGTVRDAAGSPVEGAQVSLAMQNEAVPLASGAVRQTDRMLRHAIRDPRVARLTASTDAQGAFRLEDVVAATYVVHARLETLDRDAANAPVTVRAGGVETVELTLGGGTTIEGSVVDGDGGPVAGATIQAHDPNNRDPMQPRWAHARTDGDGRFVLRSVRGDTPWNLQVHAVGYAPAGQRTARPGDASVEVRLTALGWIEGVVTDEERPYARTFSVQAKRAEGGGSRERWLESHEGGFVQRGNGDLSGTFTSADGRFVLRGLAAGTYALSVSTAEGLVAARSPTVSVVDGCAAGPVELPLERGASLAGTVLDATTRRPAGRGWCHASIRGEAGSPGLTGAGAQVDSEGRFLLSGLAAGTYVVTAQTSTGVPIEEEVVLSRGRREEKTFLATRGGSVRVVVADSEGRPLKDAWVNLVTERGNHLQPNWDALRQDGRTDVSSPNWWQRLWQTDETGTVVRHLVPAGRVQVQVHAGGKQPKTDWAVVASDRTTDVQVTLRAPGEEKPPEGE